MAVYFEKKEKLGDLLVRKGKLMQNQLDRALTHLETVPQNLGDILVSLGFISDEDLITGLAEQLALPIFSPHDDDEYLTPDISAVFLKEHPFIILRRSGTHILVLNDPMDGDIITTADIIIREPFQIQLAPLGIVNKLITEHYQLEQEGKGADQYLIDESDIDKLKDMASEAPVIKYVNNLIDTAVGRGTDEVSVSTIIGELKGEADLTDEEDEELLNESDAGIVRLANQVIKDAYDQGASDIHIEPYPGKQPTEIRFRRDGACYKYQEVPPTHSNPLVSRIKIMAKLDIAEKRLPQSGKIKLKYGKKDIELRVEVTPTTGRREDIVMRILASGKPLSIDKMAFSEANLKNVIELIEKPYGIILVVGPTGSGKTTTLHSVLGHINRPEVKIWTAEDPIEITQYGLRQVQTHAKIGYSFADAMRSFLRADPDVIMVGEMRDAETAAIGLEASLTGHLVLSTLHTNSAPETITRLIDMGMNPLNFADALLGIVAQRLVRTICSECKEPYEPEQQEFDLLVQEYGEDMFDELGISYSNDLQLQRGQGCDHCNDSGYRGRAGIHELLVASPEIKELIQNRAHMEEIRRVAVNEGMRTLKQDGIRKVFEGLTDFTQVRRVCIV